MATKNFTQFNTASPLTTSDYIVGYNSAGTAEIKTQVQSIVNLVSDSDSQTLSFDESNKNLTISSGNTVSLSSLSDTTIINSVSTQLVTNSDFNSYRTDVANTTATLLPTSIYQNASGNWQSTFTFVQNTSASNIVTQGNARGGNISIGTNDAYHLRLKTNSSAKFTILSSGEVGVGTTLAQTIPGSQLPQIFNGSFSNTTGMSLLGTDWYGGLAPGWTGPIEGTYDVYFDGVKYYNNLNAGPKGPGTSSLRQIVGILPVVSDIFLQFTNPNVGALGFTKTLNAAIYNSSFTVLASATYPSSGTYTLSAANVAAGTTIIAGFWGEGSPQGGVTDISITATNKGAYFTVAGGISATSVATPRLQVQDGVVRFTNLPTLSSNLPVGSVWNSNGILRIV